MKFGTIDDIPVAFIDLDGNRYDVADYVVNDYETMPKATLLIKNENGCLIISETEYTKQYLSKELE